jgi:hypothetical protein
VVYPSALTVEAEVLLETFIYNMSAKVHGVISQNAVILVLISLRISNFMCSAWNGGLILGFCPVQRSDVSEEYTASLFRVTVGSSGF